MAARNVLSAARTLSRLSISSRAVVSCRLPLLQARAPTLAQRGRLASTQVGNQLIDFLKNEIDEEKKLATQQLGSGESPTMPGFQVSTEDADVTLTKSSAQEKIVITFNVNHTVEAQETGAAEGEQSSDTPSAMASKPDFRVEVQKQNQKLVFECSFENSQEGGEEAEYEEDIFKIDEVYIYNDSHDKVYSASGEVMDGALYDHLMDYMAERGIDEKFAENLIKFATHYEHAQYVALLQKIKDFVAQ